MDQEKEPLKDSATEEEYFEQDQVQATDTPDEPEADVLSDDLRKLPKTRSFGYRGILLLGVLLIIAIGIGTFFAIRNGNKPAPTTTPDLYVFQTEKKLDNVQVKVYNKGLVVNEEGFKLVMKGTDSSGSIIWGIADLPGVAIDQSLANGYTGMDFLRASRILEENPSAAVLKNYGLDQPQFEITWEYADGSHITVSIGNRMTKTGGFFARCSNSPRVYLIADTDGESLTQKKGAMRSMPTPSEYVSIDLSTISILRSGQQPLTLHMQKEAGDAAPLWYLTSPVDTVADSSLISTFLEKALTLRPNEYVGNVKLADYGLDKPSMTFILKGEKEYRLEMGKKDATNENVYVRLQSGAVYKMAVSDLTDILNATPYIFAQKEVTLYNISDLKKLVFQLPGQAAHTLEVTRHVIQDTSGTPTPKPTAIYQPGHSATVRPSVSPTYQPDYDYTFRLDGQKYDVDMSKALYLGMISMRYSDALAVNAHPTKVLFSYTLYYDMRTVKVEYLDVDSIYSAVRVNGKMGMVVQKKDIDDLIEKTNLYLRGELRTS